MKTDKQIEYNRYNQNSKIVYDNNKNNLDFLKNVGYESFKLSFQSPYKFYYREISKLVKNNLITNHLDLCCGDGIHSFVTAKYNINVTAVDYAENSIEIAKKRAEILNMNVFFMSGDVESLNFENETFDLITCVGSMSYLNHDKIIDEIYRLLKKDGYFICLDSFNHNFFYKINRFIHFLMGRRSFSTFKKMPNKYFLRKINSKFSSVNTNFFGILLFFYPLLKLFFSEETINSFILNSDIYFYRLKLFSFKFVSISKK